MDNKTGSRMDNRTANRMDRMASRMVKMDNKTAKTRMAMEKAREMVTVMAAVTAAVPDIIPGAMSDRRRRTRGPVLW